MVADDVALAVDEAPRFVSRGGIKLANALDALRDRRRPAGSALDVGASTGGFTDCLLQRGAAHVIAVDVAYGELDWALRTDERVTVLERTNARALTPERAALRTGPRRGRRVVHLADQGAARRCWPAPRRASTRWRWSSRSSRSGAGGSARAASCATRPTAARRSCSSRGAAQRRGRVGARLRLLGPARAQGQPRDLRVARRGRPCRARSPTLERGRAGGRAA